MSVNKFETDAELDAALAAEGIKTTGDLRTALAQALLALDGSPESNERAEYLNKLATAARKRTDARGRRG